jgi:cobalt-zinc-cadmium efflux system protein
MSHNHSNNLFLTISLNLILTVTEFAVGAFTGSLALISDATHNSVDIVTLLITYIADRISKNKANYTHSYGYKRVGILASLLNSMILAGMAVYIFISAFQRSSTGGGWLGNDCCCYCCVREWSFGVFGIQKEK